MLLESPDLPATIPIFRMFHPDISGELDLVGLPVVAVNQDEKAGIYEIESVSTEIITITEPANAAREDYYVEIIGNDSGSPVFVVYGSELIYLSGLTTEEPMGGPDAYAPNGLTLVGAIATAVTSLNEEFSLTGYAPNYINVDLG